jgi:hypothetical protein
MKKFYDWAINFWWIILICIMVAYIVFVSVINISELSKITTTIFNYFNQIIAPLVAIIGLILGYPLLKRKLVDSYVTKQFEIIHENNRLVRKECLSLKEKYPIKYISQNLNHEFLTTIVNDVKRLNELAIDANPDAYKYSYLLYKSLQTFSEKTKKEIPINFYEHYFCETLSSFVYNHVEQIYRYSKSIGFVPKNSNIKEKLILTSKLNKYVIDNKYYQVEGLDHSFSYKKASALLVSFFSTNISCLNEKNGLLFQSSYKTAPSPSPFARIMYYQNIYMPLVLEGEKLINFLVPRLALVGYVRHKSTKIESGISTHYLICHYANISQCGFVEDCIKNKQSLSTYKDTYIKETVLNVTDIEEFDINGESIIIKIDEEKAMKYFIQVKNPLCKEMDTEIY